MLSSIEMLLVFAFFSILVPTLMILASKFLGPDEEHNSIKESNYESAEVPIGKSISTMKEYMHYLSVFIAFETTLAIALLWAYSARYIGEWQSVMISMLFVFSTILSLLSIAFSKVKTDG